MPLRAFFLMISIFKSSLSFSTPEVQTEAPKPAQPTRVMSLLTEALKENLIRAKGLNHVEFSADLDQLAEVVAKSRDEEEMLEACGKTCGSAQSYFKHLSESIDSVGLDLATSIRALATLLHGSSGNQEQFLGKMEQIRDKFEVGSSLDDIQQLRAHLDSCLTSLRSELFEARRSHEDNQSMMLQHLSQLHRSVSTLRAKVPQKLSTGPALSILRIRRLKAVRERYGDAIRQKLLDYVIQILLVRWPAAYDIAPYGEECLVVLDNQNLDLDFHRAALRKLSSEKHLFTSKHEGEELKLPIALDWTVIRAPAERDMDEFIHNFLDGMASKDTQTATLDKALGLNA